MDEKNIYNLAKYGEDLVLTYLFGTKRTLLQMMQQLSSNPDSLTQSNIESLFSIIRDKAVKYYTLYADQRATY